MKFLILCALLPCLAAAITENWDNEETFTLKGDPTRSPPSRHGPVKISLSGPLLESSKSTTTEDPILPLILRKLIEQSISNEIEQEKKYNRSQSAVAKAPLVYMTPPPLFTASSTSQTLEEDDDDISTTTETNNSGEMGSRSTTADSGEIDDFDTTVAPIPKMVSNKGDLEEDEDYEKENKTPLKMQQYAPKYQRYLPHTAPPSMEKATVPEEPEEDATERYVQNQPPSHLDRIEFPERDPHNVEMDNNQSQEPQEETTTLETSSETPEGQGELLPTPPPGTMTAPEPQQRPVYYFFLRPKQYRIPITPLGMSPNDNGMIIPPRSYSPSQDSWRLYPQVQPQPQFQTGMSFPRPSYKFPSFIAQDYENQMISPIQYPQTYPSASNYNYYPNNYQQQQQYLPMGSSMYPQYLQQNSYMGQSPMGQMYPSSYSPSSPYLTMPNRAIYRYSFNNNYNRVPLYPNNVPTSPYTLNTDGSNNYPSLYSMGYNNNYNGMGMGRGIMTPRFYYPLSNNL